MELTAVSTTGMELRKDLPFEWSSSDADIAAVIGFNERANVTGVGLGTAVITVRVGEASATTRVRVQTGG